MLLGGMDGIFRLRRANAPFFFYNLVLLIFHVNLMFSISYINILFFLSSVWGRILLGGMDGMFRF